MPRAFVAITLDDATRAAVAEEIERLRPLCGAVAWVPARNLHLTLAFLGHVPDAQIEAATDALAAVAAPTPAFDIGLHGLGGFPGMERPRILWIGVAEGGLPARGLQSRVETALAGLGHEREARPWHPHLTVGRVFDARRWQREAGPPLRAAVAEAARRTFGRLRVDRLTLMRSDLLPHGARYTALASLPLCPSGQVANREGIE